MNFYKNLRRKLRSDDSLILLLAFFLPVLAMLCIFAGNQIYPFGDNSFLRTDLYHQYAPFFAEFARKLKEGGSLLYTWDIGMGTNFISLIGYYLSSIFNWLIVFCTEEHVIEFVSYLVIIKMGLAGLTFAVLLRKKGKHADFKIPFFSLFYAMSGYLAAYSWNVMWLDCIWLAPLILLGIEQLVYEKKHLLYIVTLAMAIISNYYIAIMLCIFCVLYFLMQLPGISCSDAKESSCPGAEESSVPDAGCGSVKEFSGSDADCGGDALPAKASGLRMYRMKQLAAVCLRFAVSSLTAGALSAIILLPEIKALGLTASSDINFPTEWNSYFSILEMLARHLMNVATECGLDHWPNIYCGIGILICLPLYYLSKNIRTHEKITKTALIFFMLFSFSVNVPNFIWHGFHYPNSLPCRQSFLYIAILLIMCYEGIQELDRITSTTAGLVFAGGAAFIIICQATMTDDAFSFEGYWLSLAFLGIYTVILLAYIKRKIAREALFIILMVAVAAEATINMAATSVTTVSRSEYLNYTDSYQELIERIETSDDGFYRFEKTARKTKNDGAFVGYPSISTFSSVSYGAVSDFYERLGMESSMNAYSNNGITPLMNSLLDVKYILATTPQQESQLMTLCEQNEECYIYENLYTLSAGYMLPKGFNLDWDTSIGSAIDLQNDFSLLNGGDQLFYQIYDCNEYGTGMDISVSEPCHVFVQLDNSSIENVDADISGDVKSFTHTNRGFLLDLGYCSPEDTISLSTEDDATFQATAYYLNENALISLIKDLQEEQLQVTKHTDTLLEGTIDVEEDGLFFLSIPYDPGWTLYVDGKETEYYAFQDAFISCDLEKGEHEIRLTYMPDGLIPGAVISICTLIGLIGYEMWSRKRKQRRQERDGMDVMAETNTKSEDRMDVAVEETDL
ncbi:MAG: YfhO family protein [Lachnospiraceae bacterium]|nr:YfhO family protein [Lachnospiraceae bacterium]